MKQTWKKPRTSRVYLHGPGANRIVMLHPDFKITDLELRMKGGHTRQDACGVHLLAGLDRPDALDFRETGFDTPKGGLPIFTVNNTDPENECRISMTACADELSRPHTFVRITVSNPSNEAVRGRIGLLPRACRNGDQYLTGLWDTGYESYEPNINQWYLQRNRRIVCTGALSADGDDGCGSLRILAHDGFSVRWISRDEQPRRFDAHDYFACDYTLAGGESRTLDFVFRSCPVESDMTFDEAYAHIAAFWTALQNRITLLPKTDNVCYRDMYRLNVTQCMQMLSHYDDAEGLIVRQGDVGRYVWVWEGVHILFTLDRLGFSDMTADAYRNYISWVGDGENDTVRGKITYKHVTWDNSEGALLMGLAIHLLYAESRERIDEFLPVMMDLLHYIRDRRHLDESGDFYGLYPAGQASDWGEIGRHWTFTDSFIVMGERFFAEMCEKYNLPEAAEVRAEYEDYRACCVRTMEKLYAGHENDETFILPHIAGLSFEVTYNHCFYTDGAPVLPCYGIMDANSRIFEQMEAFYRKNGLVEHGLWGRLTNATDPGVGEYGDVYYTGIPEMLWAFPFMDRGEWDKAEEAFNAIMRYNVTTEYIVSERYCSYDPWYTPWQPNGSGSARIVNFLLNYFDRRAEAGI